MKNKIIGLVAAVAAMGLAGTAQAATVLTPDDLGGPLEFAVTNPYGWDWDQAAPEGSTTVGGAPGFGDSSWYSNVQGSAAGGPRNYTALRIHVQSMFGLTSVTMADLDEISYWTYLESGTVDWQLKIYTVPTSTGWYGHRFNFDTPTFPTGAWNQSSTSSNLDVDWILGSGDNISPANDSYYLADASVDYADEEIMFIDIIAGYATNSPPVYSYLDGVSITVGGETRQLDLQANAVVPLPGAAGLGLLGLGLVGYMRRRKSVKA